MVALFHLRKAYPVVKRVSSSQCLYRYKESRVAAGKIRKKIKKELIGTSDYPSNKIFTISNFITFTRLILTGVFLFLFVTDYNRYVALVIYALSLIHI